MEYVEFSENVTSVTLHDGEVVENPSESDEKFVMLCERNYGSDQIAYGRDCVYYHELSILSFHDSDGSWVLLDDSDEFVEVVGHSGYYHRDNFDLVYLDAGCNEGEWAFQEDTVHVNGRDFHDYDIGDYIHLCDSCGDYYEDGEECCDSDDDEYTTDYHNGVRHDLRNSETKFSIGFEVEKEDIDILHEHTANEFANNTMWAKENDSSLGYGGFELVSPIYDLYGDSLEKHLTKTMLADAINASKSTSCGGHINLGFVNKRGAFSDQCGYVNGEVLYRHLNAYVPLIIALYYRRMNAHYCRAQGKDDYKSGQNKYQAINIRDQYIEFRIVSAVSSTTNLLWRKDLFRMICEHIEDGLVAFSNDKEAVTKYVTPTDVLRLLTRKSSPLYKHLRKVYNEQEMLRVVTMYAQIADEMYTSYKFTKHGEGYIFMQSLKALQRQGISKELVVTTHLSSMQMLKRFWEVSEFTRNQRPNISHLEKWKIETDGKKIAEAVDAENATIGNANDSRDQLI